jgi:hypothetical protein
MGKAAQTYGEAMEAARGLLAAARLADPLEHFPYKHDDVTSLVAENPPMGPTGPDDDRVRAEDFISQDIADATGVYIEAQAAYLGDPGDATREAYKAAADVLVAARQAHRANRDGLTVVGVRARRAGE